MIKILIADDHQMFLDGLKALVENMEGISVVGEALNGREVMEFLERQETDLVLMDYNMPIMDGLDCTKQIVNEFPSVKVLMLSMHHTRDYIEKVLKAGAHGYILKNTGKEELQLAIETLMQGASYFSDAVTREIMLGLQKKQKLENSYQLTELTEREKEVLLLIVDELTTNEIAEKLFISKHTVETHRKNLISKLNVRNVNGLVKYAIQSGLAD